MTFAQTVEYLYGLLPMFQRQGPVALRKYDLDKTRELCAALGNPQVGHRFIHVAGTNGKGSVSSMLCAALQVASGVRIGLYTSPHLVCFTERFRVNGQPASQEWVVDFVARHRPMIEELRPSFFELTTAMAFCRFRETGCAVSVIETGMGGRLDSTNIIAPELCVITRIGFDHMEFLGQTLPEIAAEKAGIIKEGVPAVVGLRQSECDFVFERAAAKRAAPFSFASDSWEVTAESFLLSSGRRSFHFSPKENHAHSNSEVNQPNGTIELSLTGDCQRENLTTVLEAVRVWNGLQANRADGLSITEDALKTALGRVQELSGLRGRFEVWAGAPPVILDVAHNPEGLAQLSRQVSERIPPERQSWVFGVVRDKALADMLPLLPLDANYFLTNANVPRALPADELAAAFSAAGFHCRAFPNPADAVAAAVKDAPPDGAVIVGGSVFIVAEVLAEEELLRPLLAAAQSK